MIGSISGSDIIMDVVRAADPARQRKAIEKLTKADPSDSFVSSLEDAAQAKSSSAPLQATPVRINKIANKTIGSAFEIAALTSLFQNVLPASSKTTYGTGVAGSAFRSMLAEQLATQVTASGGIGIAALIDRSQARKSDMNIANGLA